MMRERIELTDDVLPHTLRAILNKSSIPHASR
jgi:Arc/MetJ family transcription regulator